ncbi:hypothetical protein RFI_16914, partial [Reticulomyxa filosa]
MCNKMNPPSRAQIQQIIGHACIFLHCILAVAMAETTKFVLESYEHPLVLRYVNIGMCVILFGPVYCYNRQRDDRYSHTRARVGDGKKQAIFERVNTQADVEEEAVIDEEPSNNDNNNNNNNDNNNNNNEQENNKSNKYLGHIIEAPISTLFKYTLLGAVFNTGGGFCLFASLLGTSVPTSTALVRLKSVFCFIISAVLFREKVTPWKIAAVAVSFIGVLCFLNELSANSGSGNTKDTWWGIVLVIFTSILFPMGDL